MFDLWVHKPMLASSENHFVMLHCCPAVPTTFESSDSFLLLPINSPLQVCSIVFLDTVIILSFFNSFKGFQVITSCRATERALNISVKDARLALQNSSRIPLSATLQATFLTLYSSSTLQIRIRSNSSAALGFMKFRVMCFISSIKRIQRYDEDEMCPLFYNINIIKENRPGDFPPNLFTLLFSLFTQQKGIRKSCGFLPKFKL